jgi:putative FmdB family regulatory protein
MPIYEYKCNRCEKEFERLVFSGEETDVVCPDCQTRDVFKKMSASSFMGTSIGTCAAGPPKGFS